MGVPKSILRKIPRMVSLLFILLFVYAAVSKLLDFETFQTQLGQSPLLSAYAKPLAIGVPFLELLIALGLMMPRFRLWALYGFYGLMVMFTTYIVIILNFSDFIPCSCGGVLEKMSWTEHLWFNLIVCLLSLLALFYTDISKRRVFYLSFLLLILSSGITFSITKLSEEKIRFNNELIRKFQHRPLKDPISYQLDYNSYYVAGIFKDSIYLGNTTAPRHILALPMDLKGSVQHLITIPDSLRADYQTAQITVSDTVFFLTDGVSGIIQKGITDDWTISESYTLDIPFTAFVHQSKQRAVLRVYDMLNKETTLAEYDLKTRSLHVHSGILDTKIDGLFDTDGQLLFDVDTEKVLYVYFYRNNYLLADYNLENAVYNRTIDTIKQVDLEFGYLEGGRQMKLAKPYKKVNQTAAAGNGYEMIKSKNLGRFDVAEMLEQASLIDVYDTEKSSYEFSFYFYHEGKEEVKSYYLYKDKIIGLTENHLVVCEMKKAIFTKL